MSNAKAEFCDLRAWCGEYGGRQVTLIAKRFFDARRDACRLLGCAPGQVKLVELGKDKWNLNTKG